MRSLIKKILKESEDEFDWVRDIPETNVEILGEKELQKFLTGEIELTNMLNVLYQHGTEEAQLIFNDIGGHIRETIRPNARGGDENNRYMFSLYFMAFLNEDVLRIAFGNSLEFNHLGEMTMSISHFHELHLLRINSIYILIGRDPGGTVIFCEEGISNDELSDILKTIVEKTIQYME